MANVAHNILTGADLHEPKGISGASANTVYVANGAGSGTWSSGSVLLGITGQIADFATPLPPTGWLECDGATLSRATFAGLFSAMTIQQTGTRTNASAIITGLTSTANMRAGYFVGAVVGGQITNGTTILTVDSATQITMNANALSSGSATVIVSPFALGDGTTTFTLPNVSAVGGPGGYFRRSRTSTARMGTVQAESTNLLSHTHTQGGNFTSGIQSVGHTHTFSGDTGGISADHSHPISPTAATVISAAQGTLSAVLQGAGGGAGATGASGTDHTHPFGGTTSNISANHTHDTTISGQTGGPSTSGAETRPIAVIVLTCIKT